LSTPSIKGGAKFQSFSPKQIFGLSHEHRPASGGVVNLSLITPGDSSVMIVSIVVQVVGTKMALTANPGIPYFAIHFRI
jgi:hypothetical protein